MSTSVKPVDLAQLRRDIQQVMQENPDLSRATLDSVVQQQTGGKFATVDALNAPEPKGPGMLSRIIDAARRGPSPEVLAAQGNVGSGQNPLGTAMAQDPAVARGVTRSAIRGATLNLDRPVANLLGLNTSGLYSPEGEAAFKQFQQEQPLLDAVGNIAGGIPSGGLLGKAAMALKPGAGAFPAMVRGLGIGATASGVSAAADGGSAGDVAGATVLGGALGAAIPGVVAGAKNLRGAGNRATAARIERKNVEQMARVVTPGPNPSITGEPTTVRQWLGDLWDPTRLQQRTDAGLSAMQARTDEAARMGRGALMTPLDADPTQNGILRTSAVNALRQNAPAATLAGVESMVQRPAGSAQRLTNDMLDVSPIQLGGLGNLAQSRVGRTATIANAIEARAGGVAPVIAPSGLGQRVPSTVGYNPDARIREIETNLRAFAQSQDGYAGLSPVIQPGSAGQGTSPEVLDRIRLNLSAAERANPTAPFRGVQSMLAMIQGGADEATPVTIGRVQESLATVNELLDASRLTRGTPGRIALDAPESAALREARDVITRYADDGFRGPQGQTFSDVSREYARASDAVRQIDQGRALVRGTVRGEAGASTQRSLQLWDDATPEQRAELRIGGIGQVLEDLRAATNTEAGSLIKNFTTRTQNAYRKNDVLRAMFPSEAAFNRVVQRQALYDAADAGADSFRTTSAEDLRAALNTLGSGAERRQFQRYMLGQYADQLQNPEGAQTILTQFVDANGSVPRSGPQWQKLRQMFGSDAPEIAGRVELEATFSGNSRALATAAQNTADPIQGTVDRVAGPGVGLRLIAGIKAAARGADRSAVKTETLKLLTRPDGMAAFSEAVRRSAAPTQINSQTGLLLPALLGYQTGTRIAKP